MGCLFNALKVNPNVLQAKIVNYQHLHVSKGLKLEFTMMPMCTLRRWLGCSRDPCITGHIHFKLCSRRDFRTCSLIWQLFDRSQQLKAILEMASGKVLAFLYSPQGIGNGVKLWVSQKIFYAGTVYTSSFLINIRPMITSKTPLLLSSLTWRERH